MVILYYLYVWEQMPNAMLFSYDIKKKSIVYNKITLYYRKKKNRWNTGLKIAVRYGGISKEREVSLSSGKGIMKALEANGHEVIGIDFHPEKIEDLATLDVDLVFIGLHGKHGEDGRVQGLL